MSTPSKTPTPIYYEDDADQQRFDREVSGFTQVFGLIGGFVGLIALAIAIVAITVGGNDSTGPAATVTQAAHTAAAPGAATGYAVGHPTLAESKGVKYEPYKYVDPTLPAVPAGAVKHFTVDVMQHVTQVSPDLAPTDAWTYVINGATHRGTAASSPIVVNEGDRVAVTFRNGGSKAMGVNMPHSIDFHSAEVAPNKNYIDIAPGKALHIDFVAKHPGVYMVHCATQPVLWHTSNGMSFMMVVKPKGLPKVDKELWMTQQEFYLGAPGQPADMTKMTAETPDVVAFNGYAAQYKANPIPVRKNERIRMWVLNAGPSKWSAFHVIGTVFDRAVVENTPFHDSQTINLAPSQGGYVEFTLDQDGNYPFVTHSFGDMAKGAVGVLHTAGAPKPAAAAAAATTAAKNAVQVSLGEFFVKMPSTTLKAGTYTFNATNKGQSMHMLMVERTPLKFDGPNQPTENAAIADTGDLEPGRSKTITVKLTPGTYEFFCNVAGHYAAGQHTTVTVTQ